MSEASRRASREWNRRKREQDPEYFRKKAREYRKRNPGAAVEVTKRWRQRNPEAHRKSAREYTRRRRQRDPNFRIACTLRSRLGRFTKGMPVAGSTVRDLGTSLPEFKKYIESLFKPGMTWENWGRDGWHLDHIKPLASFDLTDREQFLEACHYINLQPLWAEDNMRKGAT